MERLCKSVLAMKFSVINTKNRFFEEVGRCFVRGVERAILGGFKLNFIKKFANDNPHRKLNE